MLPAKMADALKAAASSSSIFSPASLPSSPSPVKIKYVPSKKTAHNHLLSLSIKCPPHSSPFFFALRPTTPPRFTNIFPTAVAQESPSAPAIVQQTQKRKLYVANLPWSCSSDNIKKLFGECGTVRDVELMKQHNGKNRGFGFVTMASDDESQAAVDKFNSYELEGRTIKVEFAKNFKKPSSPPAVPSASETSYKLFISNLQWKVRSIHLREFFSTNNFSPSSARIVFDTLGGKAMGYGFASFATEEEATAAISALDGKELMGRPIRLKLSQNQKNVDGSENKEEKSEISGEQPESS